MYWSPSDTATGPNYQHYANITYATEIGIHIINTNIKIMHAISVFLIPDFFELYNINISKGKKYAIAIIISNIIILSFVFFQ